MSLTVSELYWIQPKVSSILLPLSFRPQDKYRNMKNKEELGDLVEENETTEKETEENETTEDATA